MKKEYIILAAVIVLLSLYLIFHKPDRIHYQLPVLDQIEQKTITRIELTKGSQTIQLQKQGDGWIISPKNYPADKEKTNQILDVIDDLTVTALVSESENYTRYELDEAGRIHVKAFAGDSLKREFYIGKAAPSFHHTFVRLANDAKVYHGRSNFRSKFDVTAEGLRDKSVLSFPQQDIQEIRIESAIPMALTKKQVPVEGKTDDTKKQVELPQTKEVWQDSAGNDTASSTINPFLARLSSLRCKRYLTGKTREDFGKPIYSVHLKGVQEYSLSFFPADEENSEYPAISSQNDYTFAIDKTTAESIINAFEEKKEKTEEK
jgi:hypothetical protein